MALYSFITKQCNSDLQKHGLIDSARKYAAKIESTQSPGPVDQYPFPFLKKNLRKHFRLIMEERRVGEDVVYCFLRVFQRSDSEFHRFTNLTEPGQIHLFFEKYGPSSDEILAYLYERRTQNRVDPLPGISHTEHAYLLGLSNDKKKVNLSIVESRTWVERISTNINQELRLEYYKLLHDLLWGPQLAAIHTVSGKGRFWILYRYFPRTQTLFLVAPLEPRSKDKDETELRKRYHHIFTANTDNIDTVIRQEGLRAYPRIVTADKNLWLDVQQNKEANLSLSPEEMDIFQSINASPSSDTDHGQIEVKYPLFINGRLGSGKSTPLLYLFAEHLHFHLSQIGLSNTNSGAPVLDRPPLYLASSDIRLSEARRIVYDILRCDSAKEPLPYDLNDADIKQTIESSFGNVRSFLTAALPVPIRARFEPANLVDYTHFCQIFKEKAEGESLPKLKNLRSEIAWHVIRTYIKGMRQEASAYLDTEAYEYELHRNQQTVTIDTFELVYVHVWEAFYKEYCESEGLWDDQDLAQELLDQAEAGRIDLAQFPAVFCDEAQDITKLELEVIFQLSRFSKRNIKLSELQHVLPRIPIAFAGDPIQTLSPTGYNWNSHKPSFHNTLVRPLDPSGRAELTLNFQELEYNYRSSQSIVQFCNLIQLMRGRAFNRKDVRPQIAPQTRASLAPIYYDILETGCQQAIQSQPSLIYIVPCEEGEEEAYVKSDPFLKRIAWDEKTQSITRDILSPARVKGLQFRRVALYKFGEHALDTYGDRITFFLDPVVDISGEEARTQREEILPLAYFVQQLYIAASRPRQQLIIVDTKKALDNFWSFAIEGNQQALIYSYEGQENWHVEHITRLTQGNRENWYQITDNALKLGHDFYAKGQEKRDSYFLERARQNFEASGKQELADKAHALRLYYEGNFKEAGLLYARLKQNNKALGCFWKSRSYEEIAHLRPEIISKSPRHLLLFNTADYMLGEKSIDSSMLCIERIHLLMSQDKEMERTLITDVHWTDVIAEAIQQLVKKAQEGEQQAEYPIEQWQQTWKQLSDLFNAGIFTSDAFSTARIACLAGDYETSKKLLVDTGKNPPNGPQWTIRVFAETASFPENIRWFSQLDQHQKIVEAYETSQRLNASQIDLKERDIARVFSAYVHEELFDTARTFLNKNPVEKLYLTFVTLLAGTEQYSLANQLTLDIIQFYEQSAQWDSVLRFVTPLPELPESLSGKSVRLMMDPSKGQAYLIRRLARSEAIQEDSSLSQRHAIAKYLKTQLSNPSKSLQEHLQLQEAGAAFERTNISEDTLRFYESIIGRAQNGHADLKQWAQLRWIKVKFREASSITDESKRKQAIQIATEKLDTWNIPKNKVQTAPKYPQLEPLGEFTLPVEEILVPDTDTSSSTPSFSQVDLLLDPSIRDNGPVQANKEETIRPRQALPMWKDIPGYTNIESTEREDLVHADDSEPAAAGESRTNELVLEAPLSFEGEGGDILPTKTEAAYSIKPQSPDPGQPEELTRDKRTGETTRLDNLEGERTSITPFSPSPVSSVIQAQKTELYIPEEVTRKASLTLQVGISTYDCLLLQSLRVFEIRDRISQTRVDILAETLDVRDSYGVLDIEKQGDAKEETLSWFIKDWAFLICLKRSAPFTRIELWHAPSGTALIRLLL